MSEDFISPEGQTVFPRERSSRKTVSFEEQILSKNKHPNIFKRQIEDIVFTKLQIFSATRAVFSWGIFTCRDVMYI